MGFATVAKGLLTWIPGVAPLSISRNRTAGGGTASAAYCYGVWMKHLALACSRGMAEVPRSVLELGPGASLGTGLAALLSGAERYIAVDAVRHLRNDANVAAFWELVQLFRNRAPRPTAGFPPFDQYLDERLFASDILTDARLKAALAPARLERIAAAVAAVGDERHGGIVRYHTWSTLQPIARGDVDFVFSHVVLNHIEDLDALFAHCARWVRPGGWMTHQVDFTSLNTTDEWNGHRGYGELAWKIIAGRRPYFVSREPPSSYVDLLRRHGFEVVDLIRGTREGGITRSQLAPRWQGISDEDLATQTAFFIARRLPRA